MTKFILQGGYTWKKGDNGKAFCEEFVKELGEDIRILDCMFARGKETWGERFTFEKGFFEKYLVKQKIEIRAADPDNFFEEVKWANAIYIGGGETQRLMDTLALSPNWERELDGKTVAGSSAGAAVLAKYDYDIDTLKVVEGFGLVPVKTVVHYLSDYNAPNVDWQKAYTELKNYKEDLPIFTLAEGEYKVMNV